MRNLPVVGSCGCLILLALTSGCGFLTAAAPGVVNIVDAECEQAKADKQALPGWIDFLCTVANPKPGEAASFTYRVRQDEAPQFSAMHAPKGLH